MKKRFLPLLAFPCLGLASFPSPLAFAAESELPSAASVGELIAIPGKTFAYGGNSKSADILITSPSGASYSGSKLTIEETGVYQITYRALFGNHEEKETHKIRVDYRAPDLFKGNGYVSAKAGSFSYDESFEGVKATFQNNGVLTYSKPIDLNSLPKDTPLVAFLIDASAIGTADFSTFNIVLTDAYDSSNCVTINCVDSGTANTEGQAMYVKAGAAGQTLYGYEKDDNRHSDPSYGSSIWGSFRAISKSGVYNATEFYYDYAAQDIYGYPNYETSPKMRKVVGLNSKADHPLDPFGGFSKGLVYLSFEAKNFSNGEGNVVFTSIAGTGLSEDAYLDNDAPEIEIDLAGNADVPDAVKGRPYKIFDASSFDSFDGDVETETKVYYVSSDGKRLDVEAEEGYFTPLHIGDYEIVYKAADRFLNEKEISLSLHSCKSTSQLLGSLPEKSASCEAYSKVALPSLEDFSVSGGSGLISKSRVVIDPYGRLSSCDSDIFVPTEVGTYIIRYQAFDYLGQACIANYRISVSNLSEPIFLEEINLPVAFSKGETISLPEAKAKEAGENSPVDCPVSIYVNGSKIEGNAFAADGETVSIVYEAGSTKREFVIPVVDLGLGSKQENYLYGKGSASVEEDAVSFKASEDEEVTFVRELKPSALSAKFALPDLEEGDELKVRMASNGTAVSFSILKEGTGYIAEYNGFSASLTLDSDGLFLLDYDNATQNVSDGSALSILALDEDEEGNAFEGFLGPITLSFILPKDRTLSLSKINNQTFGLRQRKTPVDEIGPELSFSDMPAVRQMKGNSVTLPAVSAYDVLNEVSSLTLVMVKPDFTRVTLDPRLDNLLTFNQYGSYRLEYVATDKNGNSSKTTRLFSVYETSGPALKLTSSLKESYAAGEEIALPAYEVSDESLSCTVSMILVTPDYERIYLYRDEDGAITYYLDEDDYSSYKVTSTSFKLSKEGNYTLLVVARDQFYNVTQESITFRVKGGN